MHIDTAKTQLKLAQLLHEEAKCGDPPYSLDACTRRQDYVIKAGFILAKLMPSISMEMFPLVRADERDRIACRAPTYLCLQNGGVDRCKPLYFCPISGEMESPCHGGFDTCCAAPEDHREHP